MNHRVISSMLALVTALAVGGCSDKKDHRAERAHEEAVRAREAAALEAEDKAREEAMERAERERAAATVAEDEREAQSFAVKPIVEVPAAEQPDPRALVKQVIDAKGGLAKLESIRIARSKGSIRGPVDFEYVTTVSFPDKARVDYFSGDRLTQSVIYADGTGHLITRGQVQTLPELQQRRLAMSMEMDTVPLLRHVAKADSDLRYLGTTEVVGTKAHALETKARDGVAVQFYIDQETADFVGSAYALKGNVYTTVESDFAMVDGYRLAKKMQVLDGPMVVTITISEASWNPELPPDFFQPLKHELLQSGAP